MGAWFRLEASFDISRFRADTQVVLRAMQRHGLIVADNGSNWCFTGTSEPGWDVGLLDQLKTIPAQRAYEVGLVNRVVPAAELRAAAQAMAAGIAGNAPLSVRAGKAMVYAAAEVGWTAGLAEGDRLFEPAYLSQDAQEGPRAFREKRKPEWKGR